MSGEQTTFRVRAIWGEGPEQASYSATVRSSTGILGAVWLAAALAAAAGASGEPGAIFVEVQSHDAV